MIPVSIDMGIFLYIMISLTSIFTLWVIFEKGESAEKYSIERREIWNCDICTYTYVDSTHDTISKCPRCKSLNQKRGNE